MKKFNLIAAALLAITPVVAIPNNAQSVQAAVKRSKHRKYNSIYNRKNIKYTRNFYINMDNNPTIPNPKKFIKTHLPKGTKFKWDYKTVFPVVGTKKDDNYIERQDGPFSGSSKTLDIIFPDHSITYIPLRFYYYGQVKVYLPANYTRAGVKEAYYNPKIPKMVKASDEGWAKNHFYAEYKKDYKEKINVLHLTPDQQKELSEYAAKVINQFRSKVGAGNWYYTDEVQSLANDIATEYQTNHRGIDTAYKSDQAKYRGHYGDGIIRAAAKHGIDIDDNYLEDAAGAYLDSLNAFHVNTTMAKAKHAIWYGIMQMLFDGDEYGHAASLLSAFPDSDSWDEKEDHIPFAVSFSKHDDMVTIHYISDPF